jgi:hypothetical protein
MRPLSELWARRGGDRGVLATTNGSGSGEPATRRAMGAAFTG